MPPSTGRPDPNQGLMPSFLDRLIDPASGGTSWRRGYRVGLSGGIDSGNAALRAIELVYECLERTEPNNPAQLLLRRARKLVIKNFVELVRELAPESLNEVARVMGISAEELSALQAQE